MSGDDVDEPWSMLNLLASEASLWREALNVQADLAWLEASWQQPTAFWQGLHRYWKRQQGVQSKSMVLSCYDVYTDLLAGQKKQTANAYIGFDGKDWQTCSYAELKLSVDSLAASWETAGVQAGEILAILHPQGLPSLTALLAGLRLGLVICLLPPQGASFVQHRLENLAPNWLTMDPLYRHRLASVWHSLLLPNALSSSAPTRQPHLYSASAIIAQCFDPTSPTPELPTPVDANSFYLGALRDGFFSLGIKPGQRCAAPGWHSMESQPALVLTVLLSGATWVHIELAEIEKQPAQLLAQSIDVLGVSRGLRDVCLKQPVAGEKSWRYWFRQPAEAAELTVWQDFVKKMQLQESYCGNLLWNARLGGAILFSSRCRGQPHHEAIPAAGLCWQFGRIESPDLPCLDGSGRIAVGQKDADELVWTATPHIVARYLTHWHYLGNYPRGRAGRTYPKSEILAVLANCARYLALVEAPMAGGNADPKQVLLVFAEQVNAQALHKRVETEMGREFLPDRIEVLPLLPKRNAEGGADQAWCQYHYLTGELYRRQRYELYRCLSALKQQILAQEVG